MRAEADTSEGWVLVVMPYFLQGYDLGASIVRGAILYAYERIEAVVDLNHNGVPDEGEPVINISEPGRIVYAVIGPPGFVYNEYVTIRSDIGSLWLLVKPPVMVSLLEYDKANDTYTMSYSAPPPGKTIVVPPIPGNVYVSPADPRGANITISGGRHDGETFSLGPDDYLVLNNLGEAFTIRSDRPVAAVLVNGGRGPARFAVELVPLEDEYTVDGTPPMPSAYLKNSLVQGRPDVYYFVVSCNGTVESGKYLYPASISSIAGCDGVAYVLFAYRNNLTGATTLAAATLYNVSANPMLENSTGYIARLSVERASYSGERAVTVFVSPTGSTGFISLYVDLPDGDNMIDYVATDIRYYRELGVLRGLPSRETRIVIYHSAYPAYGEIPYQFLSYGAYQSAMARIVLAPIPMDFQEIPDLPDLAPNASNIGRIGWISVASIYGGLVPSTSNISMTEIQARLKFTSSEEGCTNISSVLVAFNSTLWPELFNVTPGCTASIKAEVSRPDDAYIFQGYAVSQDTIDPAISVTDNYVPFSASRTQPGATPDYTPTLEDEGVHTIETPPASPTVDGDYYSTSPGPEYPSDFIQSLESLLGVQITPSAAPGGGATSTTTTPPSTSETGNETATTRTRTQSPTTGATQTQSPTAAWTYPVRPGEELVYTLKIDGSGPNGNLSTSGTLMLRAEKESSALKIAVDNITLSSSARALLALASSISDLFKLALYGKGSAITYAGTSSSETSCPVINPGLSGARSGSKDILPGLTASYTCNYKNGILDNIKVKIEGKYNGSTVSINIEAWRGPHESQGSPSAGAGTVHNKTRITVIILVLIILVLSIVYIFIRRR